MLLKYTRLHEDSPHLAAPNIGDAGLDIMAYGNYVLQPYEWTIISTGVAIEIPPGYVGLVRGRSGLAFNSNIFVFHGTIDSSYRGEWKIKMKYDPPRPVYTWLIGANSKIAQVVIVPFVAPTVELVDSLTGTARGVNGFGSSGV